ncbi:MAG: PAC2 family protein [Candidatus Odinarchaeota archaeon]
MEEYFIQNCNVFEGAGHRKICIQGMPGIALAGKYTVDYFIKVLDARKIFDLYFYDLPPQVLIDSGLMNLPSVYMFHYYNSASGDDLLFLSSDFQPISHYGVNALSLILAEQLRKMGVKLVISLGASAVNTIVKEPKIYISSTKPDILTNSFNLPGFERFADGVITGMNGVLPALIGREDEMCGVILLVEACRYLTCDFRASKKLLEALEQVFNLKLDYTGVNNKISELDENIEKLKLEEQSRKQPVKDERTNYIG